MNKFEQWAIERGYGVAKQENGCYEAELTERLSEAWCCAEKPRAQHGEAVPYGWVQKSYAEQGYGQMLDREMLGYTVPVYLHPPADKAIGVPTSELEKLEAARVDLYEFLESRLSESEMLGLVNITGQIWKVANTKKWQAPADTNTVRCETCDGTGDVHSIDGEYRGKCPCVKDTVRVPVEPTAKMVVSGSAAILDYCERLPHVAMSVADDVYKAMLKSSQEEG